MSLRVLIGVGTPDCFVLVVVEGLIFLHFVKKFYFDFVVGVSEGAIFTILTTLLVDIALTVLGLIAGRVVELLDFIMRVMTFFVLALFLRALNVIVSYFLGVASSIALVVVIVTAGKFMHIGKLLSMRAELGFEGVQIKTEELILDKKVCLLIVKVIADESIAGVVIAFRSFVLERMVE